MPALSDLTRHGAPVPLLVAAGVVLAEGVVAAAYGVAELFHLTGSRAVMGVTTALFFLVLGVAMAACAWGLTRVRVWARGPVMLTQLIALGLAWNFGTGGTWQASVALAVPAVVVLVGMLHPRTIEAMNESERDD
ncbi:hypothetical protein [Marmoricola sp. RAF53]|uniref:hypothetical protein n=1 Tax=Marmoricola sp. RAF53 TaxID=3233059 RepID=UPI003F96EAFA